ncbi:MULTISPECIES: TetR/AcrR family transcriptional regulator [Microbacterium]|uniref:TetR/AcrR family transcriptional regulator n=1 Tax=Microbacterium TaxID=33882 RepID=UPI00278668AC|nr:MULTISPECIES: TetR/AcrR family transcriptional regulator [Microbacterium]MDQ1084345.1 AcrR family transcriptional regulator [Microbacterium sp. SORGH_AS_0344]MDQ1170379.1 AcrR family transcriptional regulator [Microbacterium proteolyticum]
MTRPRDAAPAAVSNAHAVATARDATTRADGDAGTARGRAKAERRAALLAAAARLFAARGFDGVTLDDIGAAVGVSGPAVYRHVPGKQALLAAILVDVSERLLEGGRTVSATARSTPSDPDVPGLVSAGTAGGPAPAASPVLSALVDFHVAFALAEADVIRVQDRDLDRLSAADRRAVRDRQNDYVAVWTDALADAFPGAETPAERRVRALACFALINSTPHSLRGVPAARVRSTLTRMALAALTA